MIQGEALLTDYYELAMAHAYRKAGMREQAVFEFFVRKLPLSRGFLVAAGLEQALSFLEHFHFEESDLEDLKRIGIHEEVISELKNIRFSGNVDAVPEGTVLFENEPLIQVTAPIEEAQLVETRVMNLLHFETLVASAAARIALAAPGKLLVDFGVRRAHGFEAGLLAARAAYVAGISGTSTVLAKARFGIPLYGTMAHSFIQAHDSELEAFRNFGCANPHNTVFLIDTYDTEEAARKLVVLAREGMRARSVRIDSGDLVDHARRVRTILDEGGLHECTIFVSGGLDEYALRDLVRTRAPIDGFGIGTRLVTSADAPYLDCAYKLEEYAGRPRRKRSEGKATWPGRKQVYRVRDEHGEMKEDVVTLVGEEEAGEALLVPMLRDGKRLRPAEPLEESRRRAAGALASLPEHLRALDVEPRYPVRIARKLEELARTLDAEQQAHDRCG